MDPQPLILAIDTATSETCVALLRGDRSPYAEVARGLMDHGTSDAVAVESVEAQRPRLDRFMVTLSTIITAAPLLGILGTVVGIIQSFRLLSQDTMLSDPREVAGGIATALLTTALGLVVALLTLFPYMLFRSHAGRAIGRMESLIAAAQQGLIGDGSGTPSRESIQASGGPMKVSEDSADGHAPIPGPEERTAAGRGSSAGPAPPAAARR